MKISAISPDYSAKNVNRINLQRSAKVKNESFNVPENMSMITFKSGNPRQIAHIVAEEPLFGINGGGVGTVSNDYNFLDKDLDKIIKMIPMYNQEVTYKKDVDPITGKVKNPIAQDVKVRTIPVGLPADHPFKSQEGTAFFTSKEIGKSDDLVKFLEKNKDDVFLLDEVQSGQMNWGFEENVPIKMYKARKDETLLKAMQGRGFPKELQDKLEYIFTYVDATASMPKQYADGASYASMTGASDLEKRIASGWQGQPYAKFNKALIELMPALKDKYNLDPKYVVCSDAPSMFSIHYAALKNASGSSYWQDKFFGGVGHNMNIGYDQPMGARQAIVNLGATREELTRLINSKEYIEAVKLGREEDFLRETVLKDFVRPKSGMNAFNVAIHYAKDGYSPMLTTVSEGYHDSLISNGLVSSMHDDLVELDKLGRFKGIVNPLMDPNVSPFKRTILQPGYREESKIKLKDGTELTVEPFKIFEEEHTDLKTVRDIKRQNKINLFERFSEKFIDSQFYNAKTKEWENAGSGRMQVLTGASNRKAEILGEISPEYIEKLKAGKDVKLIVSWGRGDFQKGMDTVIDSFEKYAMRDPNAVLIFGGDMTNEPKTVEKFKLLSYKPELKGRMVLMNGWTPGKDFAMAGDAALLPSRFAPCELTDLEAKKCLCTPIVPNVQGMAQKNFDPSIEAEASKMDAYKGKSEYYMTEAKALDSAKEKDREAFQKIKDSLVKNLKKEYKMKLGEDIPDELLTKLLKGNQDYQEALKKLRDAVISDEMAVCLERALMTDRNSENAEKIIQNQLRGDTTWFGNGWLSSTGKSAGELYQEYHFGNNGKNIAKEDLIKLDFSFIKENIVASTKRKLFSHVSGKKLAVASLATAAVTGLGVAGYKSGWFSPKFAEEKKHGNLSCIG